MDTEQQNNSHRLFFERLEDFGLKDCFKLSNKPFPQQTERHRKSNKKWQVVYLFLSQKLSQKLISCEAKNDPELYKFSDHNPVLITLNI